MSRGLDRALAATALVLLVAATVSALHDASQAWDVWSYHLPFAARLAGIVGPDAFVLGTLDEARFRGFPHLAEWIQGALWRVTGRAEATNLVALASVPIFAAFLRARFGVMPHRAVVALFAIPLVHVHATSSYVDLPANLAAAALALLAVASWAAPSPTADARTLAWIGAASAFAVNTKALTHPVVAVALIALAVRLGPTLVRGRTNARGRALLAAVVIAVPFVFATPLANLARYGNPYWPERVVVAGHELAGVEAPYSSSPAWLEDAPRPVRFAASVLEIGVRPLSDRRRWTMDQWTPPSAPGYRMGGFFGAYVVAELVMLAWRAARGGRRSREVRAATIGVAATTAVVSVLPQSHELRYYMVWMIVLVATNAWLAELPDASPGPVATAATAAAALAVVLAVTRFGYVTPSGSTFAELVNAKVDERVLAGVREGERVCVAQAPFDLLWTAPFHPPRHYVVAAADDPADCPAGFRSIGAAGVR